MELILIIAALILLDLLAMRFGVDSRVNDTRGGNGWWSTPLIGDTAFDSARARLADVRYEAHAFNLASLATLGQPTLRMRMAEGLRTLAARIEPVSYLPVDRPAHARA